jgi:hypothetical protein
MKVSVNSFKNIAWIDQKIQSTIPQPLIVFYHNGLKYLLSIPSKRINKIYRSKSVVESAWLTEPFDELDFITFLVNHFDEKAAYRYHLKDFYTHIQNLAKVFEVRDQYPNFMIPLPILSNYSEALIQCLNQEKLIQREYQSAMMKKEKLVYYKQLMELKLKSESILLKLRGQ